MKKLKISESRASFIQTYPFLDEYTNPEDLKGRPYWLQNSADYSNRFEEMKDKEKNVMGLTHPWSIPVGQNFWSKYLDEDNLNRVDMGRVWNNLVPFRFKVRCESLEMEDFPGRLFIECYLYPFAYTVILTAAYSSQGDDIVDVTEMLLKLKKEKVLKVKWNPGDKDGNPQNLSDIFFQTFSALVKDFKDSHWEKNTKGNASNRPFEPFSVVSFLKGEGEMDDALCKDDNGIHKALATLSVWEPYFKKYSPPSIDRTKIPISGKSTTNILNGSKRGRVIWFPSELLAKDKKRTIACYHRNLMFLSMQVDTLSRIVCVLAELSKYGQFNKIPYFYRICGKKAVQILGRLYGGYSDKTYHSKSPKYHIEQNGFKDKVNLIRSIFEMPELHCNTAEQKKAI